jgi:tetratricopeptide (TPR) repeat protein
MRMPDTDLPALRERALDMHQRGDLQAADAIYAAILAIVPGDCDTLHLSGVVALQRGDAVTAVSRIGRAVAAQPLPLYLANLGAALRRAGRPQDAIAALRRAVALQPSMAEAHCNLASVLCSLAEWDAAIAACNDALRHRPDLPEAHLNHATALAGLGQPHHAEAAARRALAARPDWPEALLQVGGALLAQDRLVEAMQAYRSALAVRPNYVAALINLGSALGRSSELEEAAAILRHAASLAPEQPEALLNLGGVLRALGRPEEARAAQESILARDPGYWPAWSNLGAILHDLGRLAEAEAAWQHSLTLNPTQPDVRYSRALSLLLAGNFAEGWEALEHRWEATQHRGRARHADLPLWGGEDLAGRTILLHAEEGFGDSIHFARYVPLVAARGGRVLLETYAPLVRLFAGLGGVARLVIPGDALPKADLQCPLQSLPRAFDTRLETIPVDVPYLRPDASTLHQWQARLEVPGLRVGLVWAGSPTHGKDRERSIAFAQLAPLWLVSGIRWFSLQIGTRAADLATAPPGLVTDLSPGLTDLAETAAALCNLDLLITVDTSVAHLGGALGRPVWLLLPQTPDWRWLLGRDDSPWYPTMRLFRQPHPGDWNAVVLQVAAALCTRSSSDRAVRTPGAST